MKLESKNSAGRISVDMLWPFCAAVCVLGAVTGTVVFCRTFSDSDITAYVDSQRPLSASFSEVFLRSFIEELLMLAAELLAAGFVLGWMLLPGLLFFRGLGIGVGVCCLCEEYELFGALYALAAVVLPAAISLVAHTLACRDSVRASFGIFFALFGRDIGESNIKNFFLRMPLYAAVLICSSAISAVVRINLHMIIS